MGRCGMVLGLLLLALAASNARAQDDWADDWGDEQAPVEIHGFVEGALASRVVQDRTQPDDLVLNEARFRLDIARYAERADVLVKVDFLADRTAQREDEIDIRQAVIVLRAASWLDVKAGRQVLTWGTGDLVFLNDLFPKDFVSFFAGRDDEYLKAPSVSTRATLYSPWANLDVVWTPVFAPDLFIDGSRLSFFDRSSGEISSAARRGGPVVALEPDRDIDNGELAVRVFRNAAGYEIAGYGYTGFFSQPTAFDTTAGLPTYARLNAIGVSLRGNLLGGIFNLESSYYDSEDDRAGDDPLVPNSQWRGLVGFEREMVPNLTGAFQYYVEYAAHHDRQLAASPSPALEPEEVRHVLTNRTTWRLRRQTLILSMFTFYSPTDADAHLRPSLTYKWTDSVQLSAGANVMVGEDDHTFFSQLQDNSNGYVRIRYSF